MKTLNDTPWKNCCSTLVQPSLVFQCIIIIDPVGNHGTVDMPLRLRVNIHINNQPCFHSIFLILNLGLSSVINSNVYFILLRDNADMIYMYGFWLLFESCNQQTSVYASYFKGGYQLE